MNAPHDNRAILEAKRQAVIESMTRSDHSAEAGPEVKELDETSDQRPAFRPVRLLVMA